MAHELASFDGKPVRTVLAGMIVNNNLLAAVSAIWQPRSTLGASAADLIGSWCVEHFRKHGTAPRTDIRIHLESWDQQHPNHAENASVQALLSAVSDEWQQAEVSEPALFEVATKVINAARQAMIAELASQSGRDNLDKIRKLCQPVKLEAGSIPADGCQMKAVDWLWQGWLARGQMAMLDALPGTGKSTFTADLAARVTRGWRMPPEMYWTRGKNAVGAAVVRKPAPVLMLSSEDLWAETICPRLHAASADLSMIYRPKEEYLSFPRDLCTVRRIVRETGAEMLIIDPILSYVGNSRTDTNLESHVRQFLQPLLEITHEYRLSTILVRHFRKEGSAAIHRGLGSQAWTAVCRHQITMGPVKPDDDSLAIAPGKSNLGPKEAALGFSMEAYTFSLPKGKDRKSPEVISTNRILWSGILEGVTANDLAGAKRASGRPSKMVDVMEAIRQALQDGPMEANLLRGKVVEAEGVSSRTFEEAKKRMGLHSHRRGFGKGGKWFISMNGDG